MTNNAPDDHAGHARLVGKWFLYSCSCGADFLDFLDFLYIIYFYFLLLHLYFIEINVIYKFQDDFINRHEVLLYAQLDFILGSFTHFSI